MELELPISTLIGFLLALVRTSSWMLVSPPFNNRLIPRTAKIGIAAAISLALAPKLPADQLTLDTGTLLGLIVAQVLTGLVLGFLTQLVFAAFQSAGAYIDLFGGFSLSQAFDPFGSTQTSVFGRFYQLIATTVLFVINGHLMLIKGFMTSFEAVPMGGVDMSKFQEALLEGVAKMSLAAIEIAGPLLAAFFLSEIALGLLSKAAPQLNILTFGFPFKILLTLLMVGAALPLIPGALHTLLNGILRNGMSALDMASGPDRGGG